MSPFKMYFNIVSILIIRTNTLIFHFFFIYSSVIPSICYFLQSTGRGSLTDEHAGVVSVLAKQAAVLTKDPTDTATVCLESELG